jgi:hypothetical protein
MTGSQIWLAPCTAVVNAGQDLRRFGGITSALVVLFYFAKRVPENPAWVIER